MDLRTMLTFYGSRKVLILPCHYTRSEKTSCGRYVSCPLHGVRRAEDLLSLLMTVNPTHISSESHSYDDATIIQRRLQGVSKPYEEVIPLKRDPAIVEAMDYIEI